MKDNLHYIIEEDGRSVIVDNGVVSSTSQPTPLPHTPGGWKDMVVSWERIMSSYGIQRSFTTPFEYVLEGARIVREISYAQNYERKIFHLIQRLTPQVDDTFYRLIYKYLYKGELDLSTIKDTDTGVTCNIMEGGLDKILKAKENTVYTIPFDDESILVKMDGLEIQSKMRFDSIEQTNPTNVFVYALLWLDTQFISSEGTIVNAAGTSEESLTFLSNSNYDDNRNLDNFFFEATKKSVSINISLPEITASLNNGLSGELYIKNSNGTRTQICEVVSDNPATTSGFTKDQLFPAQVITMDVAAGEKLYFISQAVDSPLIIGGSSIGFTEFSTEIEFASIHRTTYIRAFKPFDLFRKLIEKATGAPDYAASELLQAEWNKVITSGDAIRGIADAKIKISLSQFYDHVHVAHFAGHGIQAGKIGVETRAKYFDPSNPVYLGKAKNFVKTLATDIMGNIFKIGWQDPDVDDVNGKYAFNGSHQYSSVITRIPKEIPYISPLGADPYEIEITRINLDGKTTTDSDTDNKNYVLNVVKSTPDIQTATVDFSSPRTIRLPANMGYIRGQRIKVTGSSLNDNEYPILGVLNSILGHILTVDGTIADESNAAITIEVVGGQEYELNRIAYDTLSGVPTDTVFNVDELTPKRLLRKHGPWIRSLLYPFDNTQLDFNSTQRNEDLLTILGSETVEEKSNQDVNTLGERLFKPYYFEFNIDVSTIIESSPGVFESLVEVLEANPNRCFSFHWDDILLKGFNMKISIALNSGEEQAVKLLCAPDVDLTKLIH